MRTEARVNYIICIDHESSVMAILAKQQDGTIVLKSTICLHAVSAIMNITQS